MYKDKENKQTEEEVKKEIKGQFDLAKRYLDPIHQKFNLIEELYRSYIDKNNYQHSARVFDPRVFRIIETIVPRMVANEPTGSFYPAEDGDVAVNHILDALIKYDWRKAEMFPKLVNFVKSMLIFGTAFGRNYWDFREEEKTRMIPKQVNGRMVWSPKNKEKINVTTFDGPNFEVLNIYDCFPDPNSTNLDNMRWFIYRTFKTIDELEDENETRGTEYYKNLKELKEKIKGRSSEGGVSDDKQFREHRRIMMSTQEFRGKDESNPEIVVLRRFTRDGWCDYCPEYDIMIRECENPYFNCKLPIVYAVDYPYPGDLYGMGEIEPIDRIQRAINAVLNQRLDNVQLTLKTMWKVQKGKGVDMHTLISSPGNVITTNDMQAVEPINVPDVTGGTFVQTMNYLTSALQNGSGITDYTAGIGNNANVGNKTATGTRLIQQEANAQFKLKIQLYNHMVIEPIANFWKDLRIQYTTEEENLRIVGKSQIDKLLKDTDLSKTPVDGGDMLIPGDPRKAKLEVNKNGGFAFLKLLPDDIQPAIVGDYDFIAQVSTEQITDQAVLQENFFNAIDKVTTPVWTQGLAAQKKMINFEDATAKVFEKLNLGIDSKDVLTDIPAPEQPKMDPSGNPMPPQDPSQPVDGNTSLMDGQLPPEIQSQLQDLAQPLPEGATNGQ